MPISGWTIKQQHRGEWITLTCYLASCHKRFERYKPDVVWRYKCYGPKTKTFCSRAHWWAYLREKG